MSYIYRHTCGLQLEKQQQQLILIAHLETA